MIKNRVLIFGFVLLLIVSIFSGCIDEKSKFVGTWKDEQGDYIVFKSDNTLESEEESGVEKGTWKISNEELTINILGATLIFDYSFSNDDNTLTLTSKVSESIKVLTRQ